jgi:hypothetical protein
MSDHVSGAPAEGDLPDSALESRPGNRLPLRSADEAPSPGLPSFAFFCGVVLPLLALAVALEFDGWLIRDLPVPIPTPFHVAAIVLVPIAVSVAALALGNPAPRRLRIASGLLGAAFVVALLYSIAWIPVIPLGIFALILFGLGALPLAPHLALLATFFTQRRVVAVARDKGVGVAWPFAGSALVALLAVGSVEIHRIQQANRLSRAIAGDVAALAELREHPAANAELAQARRDGGPLGGTLGAFVELPRRESVEWTRLAFRIHGDVPTSGNEWRDGAPFGSGVGIRFPGSISPQLRLAESRLEGDVASGPGLATSRIGEPCRAGPARRQLRPLRARE